LKLQQENKMKLKELVIFGGLTSKAEAMAHSRIIPEDTVLVSVVSPTGLPVTPLCFVPIGKSLLKEIQDVLDAEDIDFEPLQVKPREISPLDVVQATDLESPEPEIEEISLAPSDPVPVPQETETTSVVVDTQKPIKKKKEKLNGGDE
jgi:hypothetical protein